MKAKLLLLGCCCLAWLATPAHAQITCEATDPTTDIIVPRNGGGGGPAQNTFRVTFCGSEYNAVADQTTFKYKFSEFNIKNDLSHWVLGLCQRALNAFVSGSASPASGAVLGTDGSTGAVGIKWNVGGGFSMGEFSFRLNGNFSTTDVPVIAKAGPNYNQLTPATIEGPSCEVNACANPVAPSYDGGYVLNAAQTRAFVKVDVPQGGTMFEFYNTNNLAVGDPVASLESVTPLAGFTRTGMKFTFADGSEPTQVFFPISRDNPNTAIVAFFLRVSDDCGQVVDVDPAFAMAETESVGVSEMSLSAQPNPVSDRTAIHYALATAGEVDLVLYDVMGRELMVLARGTVEAGVHALPVDVSALPSGVYLCKLTASGSVLTRTLTVAR